MLIMETKILPNRSGSNFTNKKQNLEIKDFSKVYKVEQQNTLFAKLSNNFYSNRAKNSSRLHHSSSPSGAKLEKISLVSKATQKSIQTSTPNKTYKIVTVPTSVTPGKTYYKDRVLGFEDNQSNALKQRIKSSKVLQPTQFSNEINEISFATRTRVGGLQGKPKKFNQDSFLAVNSSTPKLRNYLFGVMDGHGKNGHLISEFIKSELPKLINPILSQISHSFDMDSQSVKYLQKSFKSVFKSLQNALITRSNIDSNFSGSTIVLVLIYQSLCICANLGDSRAILAKQDNEWRPISLSHDHKPSRLHEKRRIEKAGGRIAPCVDTYGEHVGPERIWCKDEPFPGLAVSRALGDLVGSSVGVSCEPEIQIRILGNCDKIIVLGSDGLWEVLDNAEVVKVLSKFYDKGEIFKSADKLMEVCIGKWLKKSFAIDDVTFIVIFIR